MNRSNTEGRVFHHGAPNETAINGQISGIADPGGG